MFTVPRVLLVSCFLLSVSASDGGFPNCCYSDGILSPDSILHCQKVSDFLIALAYFSIPLELLYFISCSNIFPFKWVILQFGAFIVLCGLTHLLTVWTYVPHSFQLMLSLTIFKFLTALVSLATAITLFTLIPQLLRVKVREVLLKQKALDLDREVDMMKRQEEASWHVRMLTLEIRKSLDRHTILDTTLVELSKTLFLQNCAVWMPNAPKSEMNLTHELKNRNSKASIPISDPYVQYIKETKGAKLLPPSSTLALASSCGMVGEGGVAAIRMPLLKVSNFKGGTPEMVEASYAILVLVLPGEEQRVWSAHELNIVEVIADQVAVALSHAAVLEESRLMREELEAQNLALQVARKKAMMASQARNSFQKVLSSGMRKPMYSISGLLSLIKLENLDINQKLIIDTTMKTSSVLFKLINDVMEVTNDDHGKLSLQFQPFLLHATIKEAASLAKCLCACKGFGFEYSIAKTIPELVMGDEKRIFQVILHIVGHMLTSINTRSTIYFHVSGDDEGEVNQGTRWLQHKLNPLHDGYVHVKFEFRNEKNEIDGSTSAGTDGSSSICTQLMKKSNSDGPYEALGFTMCKRIVQMMQGNIWVVTDSQGIAESMTLLLRLKCCPGSLIAHLPVFPDHTSDSILQGISILVADSDAANRAVTRKLLEKLGCQVSVVASGFDCISMLGAANPWDAYRVLLTDIQLLDMDAFEVSIRIRKTSGAWPLIIALTSDDGVQERCLQIGMNGVLRKPVMLRTLRDELVRLLQQAGDFA